MFRQRVCGGFDFCKSQVIFCRLFKKIVDLQDCVKLQMYSKGTRLYFFNYFPLFIIGY